VFRLSPTQFTPPDATRYRDSFVASSLSACICAQERRAWRSCVGAAGATQTVRRRGLGARDAQPMSGMLMTSCAGTPSTSPRRGLASRSLDVVVKVLTQRRPPIRPPLTAATSQHWRHTAAAVHSTASVSRPENARSLAVIDTARIVGLSGAGSMKRSSVRPSDCLIDRQ